jgi:hypothetical protein
MAGELEHPISHIVRQLLVNLGVGTLPTAKASWPIGVDKSVNTPDNTIIVFNTTSVLQGTDQLTGQIVENYGIQILVRNGGKVKVGYAKANSISVLLDQSVKYAGVTIDSTSYTIVAITRSSGVISLGTEEPQSERNLFTINATVALRFIT